MTGMNKDSMKDNLNERSLHDILSDEIDRQLKENPPKKPSLEEFKEMAYKRLEENDTAADEKTIVAVDNDSDNRETVWTKIKTCRPLRAACIVVCFAAAFVIGGAIFSAITCDVDADKNPKEEIVTEDGVIIEDGGWGSSDKNNIVWATTEWDEISDAHKIYSELMMPTYIPEKYEFKHLTIEEIIGEDVTCEYLFVDGRNNALEIEVHLYYGTLSCLLVDTFEKEVNSKVGKIYIQKDENKIATIQIDDGIVLNLWYSVSDEEIVKVIEGMRN